MALADSKFDDFRCSVFNLNKKMLTYSLLVNYRDLPALEIWDLGSSKFSIPHSEASCSIEISCSLLVNSCRSIPIIHSLSALTST